MNHAARYASRSLREVARIFVKKYRKNCISPKVAIEGICIRGAETLGVSFHPLPIFWKIILRLTNARHECGGRKNKRVSRTFPEKMKLLLRGQRRRVPVVHHIETRHDTHNALLLFSLQVL